MNNEIQQFLITDEEVAAMQSVQRKLYDASAYRGWHDEERHPGLVIALIHSEYSEALEGFRKDRDDDHIPGRKNAEVELADGVIRTFDAAIEFGFDVASAIQAKHNYNLIRLDHSREERAKAGGKAF